MNSTSQNDLRTTGVVYADSGEALEHAFDIGLPRGTLVRTSSPAILGNSTVNATALESHLTSADYCRLNGAFERMALEAFGALKQSPDAPVSIVVARAIARSSNPAIKAMCISESDLAAGLSVLLVETGDSALDEARNPPWVDLLEDCDATICRVPLKGGQNWDFSVDRAHPDFWGRLRHTGWPRLGFRVFERTWKWIPFASPRGTVLVLRENPLVRETAYYLALKGFAVRSLPDGGRSEELVESERRKRVADCIEKLIRSNVDGLIPNGSVAKALTNMILARVSRAIGEFDAGLTNWRKFLDDVGDTQPLVVMSNAPYRPADVALFHECRKRGIPFAAFQHGVSKEIDAFHHSIDCLTEIASSDIFFSYNPRRSQISDGLPYAEGCSVTVGLPYEYWRSADHRPRDVSSPPVHYVSTMLYAENVNIARHASDTSLAEFENCLIKEVLGHLPHRVLFKPYPEHRYLDADLVAIATQAHENITLHTQGLDLAYLLPDPRVVITARATSTLGWCLAASKPVVFVDIAAQSPLKEDARNAFSDALFLFDDLDPDWTAKLREFLSKPIEEIEAAWNEKANARRAAFETYIGAMGPGAGRRAAKYLLGLLRERLPMPTAASV